MLFLFRSYSELWSFILDKDNNILLIATYLRWLIKVKFETLTPELETPLLIRQI